MAAWDVDRCPQHHCKLVRGQCPECRDEAHRATRRIRARSQPRDAHGNFSAAPNIGEKTVDDGDNQP